MKKKTEIILAVALIFVIAGFVMAFAGVMLGGSRGIAFTKKGIKILEKKDYNIVSENLGEINEIKVDVNNMNVEITDAIDKDYVYIEVVAKGVYSDIDYSVDKGKLTVKEKDSAGFIINTDFSFFQENVVKIHVPVKYQLREVNVNDNNGYIKITQRIIVDKINAETDNGEIRIHGVICNNSSSLKTDNGKITIASSFENKGDLTAKTSNGKITYESQVLGNVNLKTSNGSIDFTSISNSKVYNLLANTDNGSIVVNGTKYSNDFKLDEKSNINVKLETDNGSIKINK